MSYLVQNFEIFSAKKMRKIKRDSVNIFVEKQLFGQLGYRVIRFDFLLNVGFLG